MINLKKNYFTYKKNCSGVFFKAVNRKKRIKNKKKSAFGVYKKNKATNCLTISMIEKKYIHRSNLFNCPVDTK